MALQTAFQITQKASSLLAKRSRLAGLMLLWLSRQNDSAGNLAAEIPPACSMTLAFMHTRSPTAVPSACCGAVATPRPGWQEWREWMGAILGAAPSSGPSCPRAALLQCRARGELHLHSTKLHFFPHSSRFFQVITAEAAVLFCYTRITFHSCLRKCLVKCCLPCFRKF